MLFSLAFTFCLLAASVYDLKEFRIPNAILLALIALFLAKVMASSGSIAWLSHITAFGLTFGLGFLAFALGLFGGGDAKLMSVVALWIGLAGLSSFLTITALGGGALALILLALRHLVTHDHLAATPARMAGAPRLLDRQAPVPYALPITLAALLLEWR